MAKHLTLAVAGSRKTQGLVEHCAALPKERRVLVLTYTGLNQHELRQRLSNYAGGHLNIEVLGWFSFLLRDFARPFLRYKFVDKRVNGFIFEGGPNRMAVGAARFLSKSDAVYRAELGRLAFELIGETGGALIRRLEGVYDEILIDEVQDLSGYDWEILDALLESDIEIRMVGDIRQSVLSTYPRGTKNRKYAYAEAIKWFRKHETAGRLTIAESVETWRCHQTIATFSDSIFDESWGFPATKSLNERVTGHDGVFLVRSEHVQAYVAQFQPQCLRYNASCGKAFTLDYMNFRVAKGATFERVLIVPTGEIKKFLLQGKTLEPLMASMFYVAVTRATQSVAILIDGGRKIQMPEWRLQ